MKAKRLQIIIALCLLLTAAQVTAVVTLHPGESLLFECTSGVYSVIPYDGEVKRIACYSPIPPCEPFPMDDCEDPPANYLYLPMVTK